MGTRMGMGMKKSEDEGRMRSLRGSGGVSRAAWRCHSAQSSAVTFCTRS